MRRLLILSFLAGTLPLGAQATVDAGMTKAQVVERLGAPSLERTAGDAVYLFYKNGCERTCGMNDIVVLEKGVVTDAVFRSAKRKFSGSSSSPRMIPAAEARKAKPTLPPGGGDAPITIQLKSTRPTGAAKPPQAT